MIANKSERDYSLQRLIVKSGQTRLKYTKCVV